MNLPDPIIIIIAVFVLVAAAGAFVRFASRVLRALISLAGFVSVVWLLAKVAGIDLPFLP